MAEERRRRALIIGGSTGGLLAAHHLRQRGWDVTIFERSVGDLADRGAGIGTQPDLFDVLRGIDIKFDDSHGVTIDERVCLDSHGEIIARYAHRSVSSAWDRVYRPLREAFPDQLYLRGARLVAVEQTGAIVVATMEDGRRETGDLLIAADGGQSTVRGLLAPDIAPRYAGYAAWRGVIEETDLTPAEHEQLFNRLGFCLPRGELMLGMGVPGRNGDPRPGHRRYYWIWYRVAGKSGALRDIFTDATGRDHGTSIPPHLVREDVIAEIKAGAARTLAPQLAAIIARTPRPFPSAIFDLEQDRLVFGRVALLGDSAFIARPHIASGVTKAALDARSLARSLDEEPDIDAALARYERERVAYGKSIVARARYLGAHLEAMANGDANTPEQNPETVLREYARA